MLLLRRSHTASAPENSREDGVESDYPHFSTSNRTMAFICWEMADQGMLALMPSSDFGSNSGDRVPREELAAALDIAVPEPTTTKDQEARELWHEWVGFLRSAVSHGGIRIY